MPIKERPILFSGEMVRAIIEGRKTQTRRVIKPQPPDYYSRYDDMKLNSFEMVGDEFLPRIGDELSYSKIGDIQNRLKCPYGVHGDRLWVKETYCRQCFQTDGMWCYKADGKTFHGNPCSRVLWSPSIHMLRKASRITLEVTGVRVERVQDISEDDAKEEGAQPLLVPPDGGSAPHIEGFRKLWDSINVKRGFGWDENPWVWVIEFRRIENV